MEDGWLAYMNRPFFFAWLTNDEIPKEAIEGGTSTSDLHAKVALMTIILFRCGDGGLVVVL